MGRKVNRHATRHRPRGMLTKVTRWLAIGMKYIDRVDERTRRAGITTLRTEQYPLLPTKLPR